jgi:hypothetical protein
MSKNESNITDTGALDVQGLVDKRRVARATSVSPRCVDNWIAKKTIPVVRISKRCVRFHLPSVIRALRRLEIREAGR